MNQTNEKKLAQECLDAILNLKMGSLAELIKTLEERFGSQDAEQPEEGEAKVEEKKTYKIKVVDLGAATTKIPCLRALQKIYTGLSLTEVSNMHKALPGELGKEYLTKEAADEDLKALEAVGNGLKVELVEAKA